MRILIDLQGAQSKSRFRGIGRYSLSLTKAILRNRGEHEIFILLNALFPETVEEITTALSSLIAVDHIVMFSAQGPVDELPQENSWRVRTAELLREKFIEDFNPDVLLVTSLFEGSSDNTITSISSAFDRVPTAVVFYDLIPLLNPERYIAWEPLKNWYYRKLDSLKRADLLLGISQSASSEAREHLHMDASRLLTISSAADEMFESVCIEDDERQSIRERYKINRKFLMHSSAFEPRKNFEGLIAAFAALPGELRRDYQLVLVCKIDDAGRASLNKLAADSGMQGDELIVTGYVSDHDLMGLYSCCHLFVFPSLHEGFGLPVLEAMTCGAATIGSNTTSIPEVIGREDALFDPASVVDMKRVIERSLRDTAFWRSLKQHALIQSKKFSWDHCARVAIEGLEKLHETHLQAPKSLETSSGYPKLIDAIASIHSKALPLDEDVMATAAAIEKNEQSIRKVRSQAQTSVSLVWRIEGPFDSSYSLALLNRETARALDELGHFVVLHSTEGLGDFLPNPTFLEANPDIAQMYERSSHYPQESVDVMSRNLYPPRVADMHAPLNLLHHYAWEESGFPSEWVESFNASLDGITCLSSHVEKILIDAGVRVSLVVSGCGVDHWERIVASADFPLDAKSFRFLHVSSCFPRKGVDDLLQAYTKSFTAADDVSLVIKTFKNPHNEIHAWIAAAQASSPSFPHIVVIEEDLSDESLKALYGQCHVLVAPSRAEGYGLPMAEAMLSGLPVITTGWGGQLDFCNDQNSWLVDYRFERAKTHFNLFDSVWAAVDVDALARAMREAYQSTPEQLREKALSGRNLLLENHTWRDAASRLVAFEQTLCPAESLKSASHEASFSAIAASVGERGFAPEPSKINIGWISTYNTKCGIATYSEHLIAAMPTEQITILAPYTEQPLHSDSASVIRCWHSRKNENELHALSRQIDNASLNTLIIQFNYGFFDFTEFSAFLHDQIDAGRIVIVMMHASTDPFGDRPNWRLRELTEALSRCHRILVHSVEDLNRLKSCALVDNVTIFPHGVLSLSSPIAPPVSGTPLVATYGFCLPHKGLPELLEAVGILRDQGIDLRLRMVTAQYPDPVSVHLVQELQEKIRALDLSRHVELYTDFLEDSESLALLSQADLLVFAYQHTSESASGAVRYGFATTKPVAVTPLAIFDDVRDAAFVLPGTSPEEIAEGIASALGEITAHTQQAQEMEAKAHAWRGAHAYSTLAHRLANIATALVMRRG